MSTVALQIFTGAYPAITNDVTIKVYTDADPLAVIASITHAAPHLADTWSFPGLERTNLIFRIFETNAGVIVQQLDDDMNVVPGSASGVKYKKTEQIQSDVTLGFVSGATSIIFDGTGGKMDWRGWDIDTWDRIGQDSLKRGVDYSWDLTTGTFTLLIAHDQFGANEWHNVQFATQSVDGTDSVSTDIRLFSTPKIITANYSVDEGSDMSGLLIVDPADNYLEITMPDIATVVAGRVLTIEMRRAAAIKCCKLLTQGGQPIDWLQGALTYLFACPNEQFSIYKFVDPSGPTSLWRIFNPYGNFMRVGESIDDDQAADNVFNKIPRDGASLDIFQFARLYDHVLNLPPEQVVDYDDWTTGKNLFKFSLANSTDPTKANQFHVPKRDGMFERNSDGVRLPGDWEDGMIGAHAHLNGIADDKAPTDGQRIFVYGQVTTDMPGNAKGNAGNTGGGSTYQGFTSSTGGAENRPADIAIRKYLLV